MATTDDILDLRRRVEALEQRATPAPAADRPLWAQMHNAYWHAKGKGQFDFAAVIDVVATWLEQRYLDRYPGAAELLRAEAQRAREGA